MSGHLEIGRFGENEAATYLEKSGYCIVAKNWRFKNLEIDIIAEDKDVLAFVEVKTRHSFALADADFFVDWKKQKRLIVAAEAYLHYRGYKGEIRFDIVAVTLDKGVHIELIKDAFWT